MKKFKLVCKLNILFTAAMFIAAIALAGCKKDNDPVKVSGVSLNKTTLTLDVGTYETLTATVAPANTENKAVTWSSSDGAVATIDAAGKVIAVKAGTAIITVITADSGKTATCTVTVKAADETVKTMTTSKTGNVDIYWAGTGEAVIVWGDGSAPQTVSVAQLSSHRLFNIYVYS